MPQVLHPDGPTGERASALMWPKNASCWAVMLRRLIAASKGPAAMTRGGLASAPAAGVADTFDWAR
jgi:hypothetical protein